MAADLFRVGLNAANIPLRTDLLGRPVIVQNLDAAMQPKTAAFLGDAQNLDSNVPRLLYAHNVVPNDEGIQSVSYLRKIQQAEASASFDQVFTLRDADEVARLFSPAGGRFWTYDAGVGRWRRLGGIDTTGKRITRAYINGRTLIAVEGKGVYELDTAISIFRKVTLTGIVEADIVGITSSGNYCILYSKDTIFWSSLLTETDFVPSLTTGAGNAIPQDLKGPIVAVVPISGGMVVYTTKNAVAGVATSNSKFPFNFREVSNCGGLQNQEHAVNEGSLGTHYAWTTSGLQRITSTSAEVVYPEVTDFLTGRKYDLFLPGTIPELQQFTLAEPFRVKLVFLESRYLLISYGRADAVELEFCLYYDTAFKRWGKLKVSHVDCFQYPFPNQDPATPLEPRKSIGFASRDGTISTLELHDAAPAPDSVVLLGKFQLSRTRVVQLLEVEFEGPGLRGPALTGQDVALASYDDLGFVPVSSLAPNAYDELTVGVANTLHNTLVFDNFTYYSYNGTTLEKSPATGQLLEAAQALLEYNEGYARYGYRITAKNVVIGCTGKFNMRAILMRATKTGRV